ncbi:HEAT repeat domain-containing protein [Actinosynnema sp. NPDC059797]
MDTTRRWGFGSCEREAAVEERGTDRVEWLIGRLDSPEGVQAEEAQVELTHLGRGADVVGPLLRALPGLGEFGRLCAVEIVEDLDDRRAGPPLIALLDSDSATVREWAARVLGRWRVREALPAVWRAYRACLTRDDPPDWSEPVTLRDALTDLDGRHPVVPRLTAELRVDPGGRGWSAWPFTRLVEVFEELADHDQVTLYFQLWRVHPDGSTYRAQSTSDGTELDFTHDWPRLVVEARDRAVRQVRQVGLEGVAEDIVATIEWIDESDLAPAPSSDRTGNT